MIFHTDYNRQTKHKFLGEIRVWKVNSNSDNEQIIISVCNDKEEIEIISVVNARFIMRLIVGQFK